MFDISHTSKNKSTSQTTQINTKKQQNTNADTMSWKRQWA